MADTGDDTDWNLTTWEGSRREELRRWAALPLEKMIAALEEMEELNNKLHCANLPSPPGRGAGGEGPRSQHPLNRACSQGRPKTWSSMDRYDRITKLHRLLAGKRVPISLDDIMKEFGCARATAIRAIQTLRDDLGAPLEYDRELNGYRYTGKAIYQLPGLWLNPSELMALVASEHLLAEVEPGVLAPILEPLRNRLASLLERRRLGTEGLLDRIRIFQTETRGVDPDSFRRIAEALGTRHRLRVLYHGRTRDKTTERLVSPQRLVYYRDNWYLDAWCHLRNGLRTFSLDRMKPVELLDEPAREVSDADLDEHVKSGYGIFAGPARQMAILRFSPDQARWVADEHWHPHQQGQVLPDGGYELRVPYADFRELIMQILKYGPGVEVLEPGTLRQEVANRLHEAVSIYNRISKSPLPQGEGEGEWIKDRLTK